MSLYRVGVSITSIFLCLQGATAQQAATAQQFFEHKYIATGFENKYIATGLPDGNTIIIVNVKNGNITACPSSVQLQANVYIPLGSCKQLGTISVAGTNGLVENMQIIAQGLPTATIINLVNGDIIICTSYTDYTGVINGTCVAGKTF